MRLKSFQAKSMNEALKQVKEALGDDAIIVSTREDDSGWVRITAAVEQIAEKPVAIATPKEAFGFDEESIIELITDTLLKHRVPSNVSEKIISKAMLSTQNNPQKALAQALEKTFTFKGRDESEKPLILIGPPGAGKTLMTAKLTADIVMNKNQKPFIITTDIARAGGVEQLSAFLNIMDIKLHTADTPQDLQKVLAQAPSKAPIIIDTGGLNPFDPQEMKVLARLMSVVQMNAALVLPAGIDAEESAEMAMTFDILGARQIIPTRLDFARRIGGILSAADKAGLSFFEASHTPHVANGITHLTSQKLAEFLMPYVVPLEQVAQGKKGKYK